MLGFPGVLFPIALAGDDVHQVRGLACSRNMKLDDFSGGVTLDFRDLLEGWAGPATSIIAFLIAPDDVGLFWPRDFRADQKVPQVLWPAKCNPVPLRDGLSAGGGWCSRSSCCPPRCAEDEVWVLRCHQ